MGKAARRISLKDIDDDNSAVMQDLVAKFDKQYGAELSKIISASRQTGMTWNEIQRLRSGKR